MINERKKYGYVILYITLFAGAILLCLLSEPLQNSTTEILEICAKSVIPSLFPFMVISSLLTQSAPYLFSENSKTLPVIGMPTCSIIAIILGALCGFPTGVVTVAGLRKRELISEKQAEDLAMISNNTGPAFVIEVIGASFWGSRIIGIKLYLIQLISCLILGLVYFLLLSKSNTSHTLSKKASPEIAGSDIASFFCEAISSASIGVIKICGFIVFFSVVVECISLLFPGMNSETRAIISAFLEFTSGCKECSAIGSRQALALSAFTIGFSGLSVLAQSASFASKAGFSLRKTFIFKLFQGLLCAVLAYFII